MSTETGEDQRNQSLLGELMTFVFYIKNPGPRPAFYLVAEHLWGSGCNCDSDGNSETREDNHWTELTLSLRDVAPIGRIDIDPFSTSPLVLALRSTDKALGRRAAEFIVSFAGGSIEGDG